VLAPGAAAADVGEQVRLHVGCVAAWLCVRSQEILSGTLQGNHSPSNRTSSPHLIPSKPRDGSIAVTHTDTARLVSFCHDFTLAVTPLHALVTHPSDPSLAAAAWMDRFVVFEAPWRVGAVSVGMGGGAGGRGGDGGAKQAAVIAEYWCPEVRARGGAVRCAVRCFASTSLLGATPHTAADLTPPLLLHNTQVPDSLPAGIEARLAFLPGHPHLLVFSSPCLQSDALLFDAAARAPLRTLALSAPPAALAASPCGGLLAFGLADGRVLLADAERAGAAAVLTGHVRGVRAVAFAGGGGGRLLVSGAGDVAMVWRRRGLCEAAEGE
jgi:hypothetical protein